ncbi:MAG TPA: OstA-like protein [Bacteroidia bacterium]|nr:OstA-like protein [Bacteroidia bacterium]
MYKPNFYTFLILALFVLLLQETHAQKKSASKPALIRILNAQSLSYDESVTDARILKGQVECEHEGALLYCDTAYIYEKENRMVASGHIVIVKGDSLRVTGERLLYEGKTKIATLINNVRCVDKDMVLTTPSMIFDIGQSLLSYYNSGVIVNKKNTLSSRHGHYNSLIREATFQFDVKLSNPDYVMECDTLRYRLSNKTAYFLGPSIIRGKSDYIYCENGWYDTEKEKSQFSKNALLVTSQQKLRGDSLSYDRINKTGRAFKHVSLIDTGQHSVIYGNYAEYKEFRKEAFVCGRAIYARLLEKDTLFIGADSLYHLDLDSVNNLLVAFHHVRIYNAKVQGRCDSAAYNSKDSGMVMHGTPVLWGEWSQASARKIRFELGNNSLKGFELDGQASLLQQVDSTSRDKYNQLAGNSIKAVIQNDTVRKATIKGNVEILYFPKSNNKIMGLNNTSCKEAVLWFRKGDIDRVALKPKSSGALKPLKEIDLKTAKLDGFNWQYQNRPRNKNDLHPLQDR